MRARSLPYAYGPEILLILAGGFLFLRDLGGFPAPWTDDSIFMTVARMLAEGRGYAIPIADTVWEYPSFLATGPLLILPSALAIKLFGFSVAAARLPMVLYLALTSLVFYRATSDWCGRTSARLATALLISLSAFVNNGKPVLGEVPGILFTILALWAILRPTLPPRAIVLAGAAAGAALLVKITFAPVLGAFAVVALLHWRSGRGNEALKAGIAIGVALAAYLPWFAVEIAHGPGILPEIVGYLRGDLTPDSVMFHVVRKTPGVLLRIPFLAFVVTLILGMAGLWRDRDPLRRPLQWSVTLLVLIYLFYYLDLYGWYRHLITGHVLLLPFVPNGAARFFGKRAGAAAVLLIIALQGWWQWSYRGSSRSTGGADASAYVMEHFRDRDLIIQQPEVFVRLPWNARWIQMMPDVIAVTFPGELRAIPPSHRDAPILRRLGSGDTIPPCRRAEPIAASYHLLIPVTPCPDEGPSTDADGTAR